MPSSSSWSPLEDLRRARTSADVRHLVQRCDTTVLQDAWGQLAPAERAALLLMRNFNGTIIHELSDPSPAAGHLDPAGGDPPAGD